MTRCDGLLRVGCIGLTGMLLACSSLPPQPERSRSSAILDTAHTRLGRAVDPHLAGAAGVSVFEPLGEGTDAFVARVVLARAADRTLDVQYYIFHADETGIAFLGELLAAADRGVRVRLLLDDMDSAGRDEALSAIDAHPNVEVRLFNPFANRGVRWIEMVTDFSRINRRMHNKSMTADSQVTIVGGRNVGNEYFAAGAGVEFGDFDVLAAGPVVREVSAQFDEYWNSEAAWPMASLARERPEDRARLAALRADITGRIHTLQDGAYAKRLADNDLVSAIAQKRVFAYRGRGTVIADRPEKIHADVDDQDTHAIPKLAKVLEAAQTELILVSPYFVPGRRGTEWLQAMTRRGVRVTVLTNSFEATDVRVVHAGYAAYRVELLRAGVELYELRPSAVSANRQPGKRTLAGSSKASLHAKTYMVDGKALFVGSLNLDPRSARLNTEMGIVVESDVLCADVRRKLLPSLPDIAWRVELDAGPEERLVWIGRENGVETRTHAEPGMGLARKVVQGLLRLLPIEDQL